MGAVALLRDRQTDKAQINPPITSTVATDTEKDIITSSETKQIGNMIYMIYIYIWFRCSIKYTGKMQMRTMEYLINLDFEFGR